MPLSSPQMSIWLDIQTGRDASAYNLCELVELRGQLDVPVMIEAIVQSLTEADSLHLRFGVQQGVPVQSLGVAQADVAVVDLSVGYADEAQREACAWREIEALKARPFDLERGGLSRDRIIRLGPERHWWVRLYHHLVLDGFSGRLHASRTAALYNARLRGVEPAPSGLGDYRAFIAADAAYPASRAHGLDLAYWRERLAQGHRPARFGAGAGGPSASMPPHMLRRPVRPELIAGVKQISAQAGVTFYAVLLAAYLLFLGRHAGTFRPACALPLVNRRGRAERATLGHFVNVLPFGISLDEHHSFIALSQAVGRQLRSDLRHMRLGGGLMRAAGLDPWAGIGAGTGSGTGAGVATFNVLDYPSSQPFAGLEANLPLVLGVGPVEDLMLVVSGYQGYPPGAEARFCWWYNPAVHDAAAMAYRAEGFEALLQALCRDAQGDPAGLPLMGDGQAARIRDAEQGPALGEVVHVLDRIQAHVQRNPQARALSARQQSASYAELAQMAAAVAARLREAGIRPEEPVGLCLHPSIEVVAGFLGILLAGGASLQLDPQQPPAQLQGMIGDLGCRLLLVEASTRAMVAQGADLCLIELDARALRGEALSGDPGALWGALGGGQGGRRRLLDDRLICLLHTSGSSGRPKPVGLSARALAGRMDSMAREFGLGEADECSCVSAALGFDPWLEQVLLPLCTGSSLWLPERQLLLDGPAFWRELKRQGVTHFNPPVPSLLSVLLSADGIPEGLRLRRLVLGGERLSADLLARAQALLNPATIWNMYGPTEATIEATGWPLPGGVPGRETEAEIPIGRPLPGMVLRILDERLRRLPFGVPGEIYIGGAGLAQGYLNRAAETAERFIPDPYGPPGARLYRSGDLGLWRADGVVLFRGRRDEQVKLRGQRVELAHVEAVIKRQPGVEDGVVLFESNPYGGRLIAHVVGQVSAQALKAALKRELSAAAVPQTYVMHQALPLLPSGKLDRRGLADQARDRPTPGPRSPAPSFPASGSARRRALQRAIAAIWAELLDAEAPAVDANLFETGVHSLLVLAALPRLSALAGREVSAVEVFRYPSIAQLAAQLAAEPVSDLVPELAPELAPDPGKAEADRSVCLAPRVGRQASGADAELAIVGLALRVPGAEDVAQFWRNLLDGVDSVGQVDAAALRLAGLDPGLLQDPRFISAHGRIHGIEQFDPAAFGYSPGEAALIDPQQRLLLELALHALEDAACDPAAQGPVGAFVGLGFPSYLVDLLAVRLEPVGLQRYAALLGNSADHAATRLAYKLGLGGPAMAISSACSSGLVAVAQAAESLRAGRCRAALAGALSLGMNLAGGYSYAQGGIGSASGRCRPFDAAADGTLGGSGGAMLVLKRLTDALADGDCIHAIIRGIGLNNDGSAKAAFTAPGLDGQVACLRAALADAGVAAESIGFVEGHGTATALGDPIEVAALNQAYGAGERGSVLLGSVKGNIGHLDAAAGVIGLVKAVLAVREGRVPPTCHFTQGNPRIPFAEGPFRVNTQAEPWPLRQGPRRAGVSSFGVGGSNAHLIVEQAPERGETAAAAGDAQAQLLPLSAASREALGPLCESLGRCLGGAGAPGLADAAYSLQRGRRRLRYRRALVARDLEQALARLAEAARGEGTIEGDSQASELAPAFVFPGQGSQVPGMGRALYAEEPLFRAILDEARDILAGSGAADVPDLLLGDPADKTALARLTATDRAQPALFVIEYALARQLQAWGIVPSALAGHSLGEYVAACVSGVMDFARGLALVCERGRLMASAPAGAMLALSLAEEEALALLEAAGEGTDRPVLAAVNAPRQCVAAGTPAAIDRLERLAQEAGRPTRRMPQPHAFHSPLMEPILAPFADVLAQYPLAAPKIPFTSNLSGSWIEEGQAKDPDYWCRHLRGGVRFADNLAALKAEPGRVLIEVGPGLTLSRLARANGMAAEACLATQPTPDCGREALLDVVARLWVGGIEPDWQRLNGDRPRRRVALPGYPFQRQRVWIQAQDLRPPRAAAPVATSTPLEGASVQDQVVAVWQQVFGVASVDLDADFYAQGGDSLLALRLAALLGETLGFSIPLELVLESGSPAQLAHALENQRQASDHSEFETGTL